MKNRMKILLTADLHAMWHWYEWISAYAPKFDLICIAGDILDGFHPAGVIGQMLSIDRWCGTIDTPLALCSGNHDANGDPIHPSELLVLGNREAKEKERMARMFTEERWMNVLAKDCIVTDGQSRLLALGTGRIVVTTIPYRLAGTAANDLWVKGASLREEYGAPWIVLHHEPPAGTAVGGRFGDDGVYWRVRSHQPDFLMSGHIHQQPYAGDFADHVNATWCFNSGQALMDEASRIEVPNHIVLDLGAGTATWNAAPYGGEDRICRLKQLVPSR